MKQTISFLFCIFASYVVVNAASSKFELADSAYNKDDFASAIRLYEEVIASEGDSPAIYFNLGDAYYRLGQKGKALLNYERALRLAPNDKDIKANIEFINGKLQDKLGESGNYYSNAFSRFVNYASSNAWAICALIAFLLFISGLGLYFFTSAVTLRKLGFFSSIVFFIIAIICMVFAFKAKEYAQTKSYAIVVSPEAVMSTSPREPKNKREEAAIVHEGYKLEITDSVKISTDSTTVLWYNAKTTDNTKAWIKSKDVEII